MAKLSKYTQAQNIAASDAVINDSNAPYTFKNWLERNIGILPDKQITQYENYVKQWYTNKKEETPTAESVKEDYINLLKQLTLAFKNGDNTLWYDDINFDDPDELEQIIPFYASKLKEIAIYLINKREAIRRAKLKYNMTGTYSALERIFYEYLLKAFTKRQFPGNEYITNITDLSVLNAIPELSAVRSNFQITVEELYDDASYFDRDPTLPASAYFTYNSSVSSYLDSLNISPDEYEWLYNTGVSQLCADNPLLWSIDNVLNQYKDGIPLSAVELYDSDVLNDYNRIKLTQKYLGEEQYILSGGYWIPWTDEVEFGFNIGNNWFYWLTGENVFENDTNITIDPISLSSTNLIANGSTAGLTITSADIIYITRNNLTSGAWLRLVDKNTFAATMSARISKGKTIFAFPYPGYGLSGEDLEWTGKSLDNLDQTFFYLNKDEQNAVYNAYWDSSVSSVSSFTPIYINDTTLIDMGVSASENFNNADYIVSRSSFRDGINDYVYSGDQSYAWLYKMMKTDLPIRIGENNLYWPFERYDTSISMFASSNQCAPITLSSISMHDFAGAVAGYIPEISDKIFKKKSPNSFEYNEGAWLMGSPLSQPIAVTNTILSTGCYQPGLFMRVLGGLYGSFIWTDDTISANMIFNNIKHQDDCWYLKEDQFSLQKEKPTQNKNLNYNQWQNCTCRAILYSPLGHPGNSFDLYDGMADYIVAITSPMSSFSFKDWKGIDGKSYINSNDFGWFRLNGTYSIEPDVGWGGGEWVTNTGNPFMLSAGVMYLYFRHNMYRDDATSNVPYLITKHKNINTRNKWNKLYFDKITSSWKDAGIESDMIINPGDILYYNHNSTYSFTLTSSHYEFTTSEVPVIPDFTHFSINSKIDDTNLPITNITVPIQAIDDSSTSSNIVLSTINYLSADYYDMPTGEIKLSASFSNPLSTTVFSVITTITTVQIDYYTYINESVNFMLNIPLYGWNYDTSTYDINSLGARPFWAIASDKDDAYTKQKGINIWAGSPVIVDEYNFKTQPEYSNMVFENNTYIEYNKRGNDSLIWKQPVNVIEKIEEKKWCNILIDTNKTSNLSSVLYNNYNDLVISATDMPTNIFLDIVQDKPLNINYFARQPFTWVQGISNSTLGLPPTGGIWIPITNELLVQPNTPYAHLSNRHYPTYAMAPSVGELYSTKDSGGYMIPRLLGVSTAISKNMVNGLNTAKLNNNPKLRGTTAIYRDLSIYNTDRGLSHKDQISPVENIETDDSWLKASITEGANAGKIINARTYQEFMPYQTQYECKGINDNGIFRQGNDAYDPWFGEMDITWENDVDWPANWRNQYNIREWYEQQNNLGKQTYQWKTDIFGNQYAILKSNINEYNIYDKKHNVGGSLWTRNARNIIQTADVSLANVFSYIPLSLSSINLPYLVNEGEGILDMDIWYDTLMLYTSAALFFFHLNFDYETGIISSTSDDINYIITENSKFGGIWLHEDDKKVTICTLLSCGNQIRPILRSLNLETNQINYLYNIESSYTDTSIYPLSSFDHPVITYDKNTKVYNISYLGTGISYNGMFLTTINIKDYGDRYDIYTAKTIIPNA
ncbi:MAG: hypothetical protein PHS54_00025 [Clostridia bacterium]|nr:hypothetical protein [Clostridia bacterium]